MISFSQSKSSRRLRTRENSNFQRHDKSCGSWLLTGCTGLVGRFVLRELLLRGKEICVLTRRRGPISAHDRIEAIVQFWEQELQTNLVRPKVVEANLLQKNLGISNQVVEELEGQFAGVLHCAASVRFELDQHGLEPLRSNIDGTGNLIDFCAQIGVEHFHHVSTAYVCGLTNARVFETPVLNSTKFRNPYEYSKAAAERLVLSSPHFASKTIYRPSIVLGRISDGFANAFHTLYSVLRLAREIEFSDVEGLIEHARMEGEEENNVVPVDWVASAIATVINQPKHWGQIYHLTNPEPTRVNEVIGSIFNAVIRNAPQWSSIPKVTDSVSREEAFQLHLGAYTNYFHDDPVFDRTNLENVEEIPTVPKMGIDNLTGIFEFAIQNKFCDPTGMASKNASNIATDFARHLGTLQHSGIDSFSDRLKVSISGVGGGTWHISIPVSLSVSEVHFPMWVVEVIQESGMSIQEAIKLGLIHSDARNDHGTELLLSHLLECWQQAKASPQNSKSWSSPQLSQFGGAIDVN